VLVRTEPKLVSPKLVCCWLWSAVIITSQGCSCNKQPSTSVAIPKAEGEKSVSSTPNVPDSANTESSVSKKQSTEQPLASPSKMESGGTASSKGSKRLGGAKTEQIPGDASATNRSRLSPSNANAKANQLMKLAQEHAASGDTQKALVELLEGWQLVREYQTDEECRHLADLLYSEIQRLGELNNENLGASAKSQRSNEKLTIQ